ncbi:hypothetical protein ACFE04_017986 [Oxalis oulophora]
MAIMHKEVAFSSETNTLENRITKVPKRKVDRAIKSWGVQRSVSPPSSLSVPDRQSPYRHSFSVPVHLSPPVRRPFLSPVVVPLPSLSLFLHDIEVAKYLQKYREDSEKCTAVVEGSS